MRVHVVPDKDAVELRRLRREFDDAKAAFGAKADAVRRALSLDNMPVYDETFAYLVESTKTK